LYFKSETSVKKARLEALCPVIQAPQEFQSPFTAIQAFSEKQGLVFKEERMFSSGAFQVLVHEQERRLRRI
jgi:hypothetical protein